KGMPSYLASLRRLLYDGKTLKGILEEEPNALSDFLEIEWRRYVGGQAEVENVISVITFANRPLQLSDLQAILNLPLPTLEKNLRTCRIVECEGEPPRYRFISEAHRQFAANRLADKKQSVINRLIDHVLNSG